MKEFKLLVCMLLMLGTSTIQAQFGNPDDLCDNPFVECWDGENPGSSFNKTAKDWKNGGTGFALGCITAKFFFGKSPCGEFNDGDDDSDDDDDKDDGADPSPDEGGTDVDPDTDEEETTQAYYPDESTSKVFVKEFSALKPGKKTMMSAKVSKAEALSMRDAIADKKDNSRIIKVYLHDKTYITSNLISKAEYNKRDRYEFIAGSTVRHYSPSGKLLKKLTLTCRVYDGQMVLIII